MPRDERADGARPHAGAGWLELSTAAGPMRVYRVAPGSAAEPLAAVIVLQEAFGVNEHIQDVTRRVAAEGYLALAPDLFHRGAATVDYADHLAPGTPSIATPGPPCTAPTPPGRRGARQWPSSPRPPQARHHTVTQPKESRGWTAFLRRAPQRPVAAARQCGIRDALTRLTAERDGMKLDIGQVVIFEVVDGKLANSFHIPCDLYAWDDFIG